MVRINAAGQQRELCGCGISLISLRLDTVLSVNCRKIDTESLSLTHANVKCEGKQRIAVCKTPHRYGNLHAIWDHTSVTCHPTEVTFSLSHITKSIHLPTRSALYNMRSGPVQYSIYVQYTTDYTLAGSVLLSVMSVCPSVRRRVFIPNQPTVDRDFCVCTITSCRRLMRVRVVAQGRKSVPDHLYRNMCFVRASSARFYDY